MSRWRLALVLALLAVASLGQPARGDDLLMARSTSAFPEAMLTLQAAIGAHGYTVSRVQRVDVGLTRSGFKTDKYRIVFFGKPGEVRDLAARYPQLIPYLPLKITIFAEGDDTLLATFDPTMLRDLVPDADMRYRLQRWKNDLLSILQEVREGH